MSSKCQNEVIKLMSKNLFKTFHRRGLLPDCRYLCTAYEYRMLPCSFIWLRGGKCQRGSRDFRDNIQVTVRGRLRLIPSHCVSHHDVGIDHLLVGPYAVIFIELKQFVLN